MALNDITFIQGQGGLGRPLAGEDHISGMVFYLSNANLPSGFGTSDRIKQVFSLQGAETLGISEGSATNGVLWYHISQFFRIQPDGVLWIGIFDNTSVDLSTVEDVQTAADGKIRQIGVYDRTTFASAAVTTLQVSATNLETIHKPLSIIYAADTQGGSLGTLADLSALTAKNVSVTIGEDGAGTGAALAVTETVSVTDMGAILGAISLSKVSDSIEHVGKFDFSDGTEFDVAGFATGDLVKDQASSLLSTLKDKGYMFMIKHVGSAGTHHENSATSIALTNDFAKIENNRTADKAKRQVRTFMLPNLGSPITVNTDGTLTEGTIARFKNDADRGMEQMLIDEEISAFAVVIDPSQNILATSKLVLTLKIIPVGIARQIEINIGFVVSI